MGWGDAWAGLSQQSFGLAVDSLRGMQQNKYQTQRDEAARIAEEKREKARRAYEERMQAQKMEFEKGLRAEDRMYRMKEGKEERAFRASESAAQRELTQGYYDQMAAAEQARLGLQREEMGLRERQAKIASKGLSQPAGPTANRVDTALMQEYAFVREQGDQDAKIAAGAIYGSNASPEEKLQRLRALIGRMSQPTGPTGIQ